MVKARIALALLAGALFFCATPTAHAYDVGDTEDALSFSVHGFASQGFILSLKNDYLVKDSTKGSFRYSELGLNVTKQVSDDIRIGVQAFAQDFGSNGNYNLRADWFYVDWRWRDWLGFRAGRNKIPYGLLNEVNDVDAARNAVLMPQSVYPQQSRELLYAQTGFELYGYKRIGESAGAFSYQAYAGRIFLSEADLRPGNASYRIQPNVPWVAGGRVIYDSMFEGLRFAYSFEAVRLNVDLFATLPDGMPITQWATNRSKLHAVSAEYTFNDFVARAEYVRTTGEQDSDEATTAALDVKSDRMYVQMLYRFDATWQVGTYYALTYPNIKNRDRHKENVQHDIAATLRLDATENLLFKLEGHLMQGTAGLMNPLMIGPQTAAQHRTWGVFLFKTTGYF